MPTSYRTLLIIALILLFGVGREVLANIEEDILLEDGRVVTIHRNKSGRVKRKDRYKLKKLGVWEEIKERDQEKKNSISPPPSISQEEKMKKIQEILRNKKNLSPSGPGEPSGMGIQRVNSQPTEKTSSKTPELAVLTSKTTSVPVDKTLISYRYSRRKVKISYNQD